MQHIIQKTFAVPPLGCNCSILGDPESREAVIVDPGGNPEQLLDEVRRLGLTVVRILHTHAHFDHFLASGDIRKATQAPLCLHPDDEKLWKMLDVQCRAFGVPYLPVPDPDCWIQDGEALSFGSVSGQALHTPGHTPGSLSFYFAGQQLLLSGDTLFRGGIGRTDLWGGDARAIQSSILERLFTLDSDTRVIPGHGPATQIGLEREYNPFVAG